jgi:hypothetical protein
MTQDEIIDMAIQAGASPDENKIWLMYAEEIETFAKLVAAKATAVEREACAKLVKDYMKETAIMEARGCLASVAYDIRARGEQA